MVAASLTTQRESSQHFYVWMAVACAIVAFGGFAPTYWTQVPAGTFIGPPLLHVHAALFSAWTIFLLSQASLAAAGRLNDHRAFGLVGISLATAMVIFGVAVAILSLQHGLASGYGDRARAFFIVPITAIATFAGFFIAAICNIGRPEWHKRFILVATAALLAAAVARIFFVAATGGGPGARPGLAMPPPVSRAVIQGLLVELLIVAGAVYDWRRRGKPHPAWIIGAAVQTAVVLVRIPLSTTSLWYSVADAAARIAG